MVNMPRYTKKEIAIAVYNEFLEKQVRIDIDLFSKQASIILLPHHEQNKIVDITKEINILKTAKKQVADKLRHIDAIILQYEKEEQEALKKPETTDAAKN